MKPSSLCILPVVFAFVCPKAAAQQAPADANNAPHPMEVEFKKLDKDQNGSMSYDEFAAAPRPNTTPEQLQARFKSIDLDANGSLSVREFALSRVTPPKVDLAKLDTDKNGTLSLEEYKQSPAGKANPDGTEKQFKKYDADSNGQLDLTELTKIHDAKVEALKKRFP